MDNRRLKEACAKIKMIRSHLPEKIYPEMVSTESKIPFKVLTLRELLIHRIADLGDAACELYSNNKVIPAIIITRALMETVALIYYIYNIVNKAIINNKLEGFDDKIMRLLLGRRSGSPEITAINIMESIRALNEWFEHFLEIYENLSDMSHPNWCGGLGYYGKTNEEEMEIIFGEGIREIEAPFVMGVTGLLIAVDIFINFYDKVAEILPDFTRQCENAINKKELDSE